MSWRAREAVRGSLRLLGSPNASVRLQIAARLTWEGCQEDQPGSRRTRASFPPSRRGALLRCGLGSIHPDERSACSAKLFTDGAPPQSGSRYGERWPGRQNAPSRLSGSDLRCLGIDGLFGEVGEHAVGVLLLHQRRLEQSLGLALPELLRPGDQGAVAGDLVVLDGLSSRDDPGISGWASTERLHDLLAFGNDALDGLALHAFGLLAQTLEHLVQAFHLLLGFLLVDT